MAGVVNLPRTALGRSLLRDSLSWGLLEETYGALVAEIDFDVLALDCQRRDPRFFDHMLND